MSRRNNLINDHAFNTIHNNNENEGKTGTGTEDAVVQLVGALACIKGDLNISR